MSNKQIKWDAKAEKAKLKAQAKAEKTPKTIKITTLAKHIVIAIVILCAFIGGTMFGQYQTEKNQSEIDRKAIIRVQDIKELFEVVKK